MSAEITDIVGFDLGHGETAVSWIRSSMDSNPEPLPVHGRTSQVTALAVHPTKGILVGQEALLNYKATTLLIGFKRPPDGDAVLATTLQQFLGAYYQQLKNNAFLQSDSRIQFCVGCPSGWTETQMQQYQEILAGSGAPSVRVLRESRAAMLHAKLTHNLPDDRFDKGMLVVDMGSSTLDFTLVMGLNSQEPLLDFGEPLGASLIDELIFEHSLAAHPDRKALEDAFGQEPRLRMRCLYRCRQAKEEYFTNEDTYVDTEASVAAATENLQGRLRFAPVLDTDIMNEILSRPLRQFDNRGWSAAFDYLLRSAQDQAARRKVKLDMVIFTGGASRMGFVRSLSDAVFKDAEFVREKQPELSIAHGLARLGRMDVLTARFDREVQDLISMDLPNAVRQSVNKLGHALAGPLVDSLVEKVSRPAMIEWRKGDIPTLARLAIEMQERTADWLKSSDGQQMIASACESWTKEMETDLQDRLAAICQRNGIPSGALGLRSDLDRALTSPDMNVVNLLDDPLGIVAVIVAIVIATLLGGGGTALLLAGPIGWFIGLVVGLVAGFGLVSMAEEKVKEWNIPVGIREMLLSDDKMKNELTAKRDGLVSSVRSKFDDREVQDKLTRSIADQLQGRVEGWAARIREWLREGTSMRSAAAS